MAKRKRSPVICGDRKVYLDIEATVMVPVRVKFSMIVRADADASIEKCIKLHSNGGKPYAKADVEDVQVDEIVDVNGYESNESSDELEAGVQESLEYGTYKVHKIDVVDSK